MSGHCAHLRAEGAIGRLMIPNRVVLPAMGVNLAARDGAVTEAFRAVFPDAVVIGDARAGGRILEATQDARGRAFAFEPWA